MRKNEYKSLEEFTSQYIGVWGPSDGHWFGLDFIYKGVEYRFHTWAMYKDERKILPDGRKIVFRLYRKNEEDISGKDYVLLGEFATMEDALDSTCIEGTPFREIIMDDDTELQGQD